ncbi:N-acetylmuramoyl-L-alanine amidase [Jannaschia sp. S6380]|uniref:N-acetylmuramoyl-L-alanine amidase family protein n=1 Tax=Jannaschia sp. S6380 TaxID=2926408 RepID=UPI001FF64D6F|nr:N-acetylmuramoyl-L-alanine amidase [Jannaschia sp. S6380]MCK0167077.1 N-acetylmuramoyl-L-alanine amidase [Jannaschia sp. S6380]
MIRLALLLIACLAGGAPSAHEFNARAPVLGVEAREMRRGAEIGIALAQPVPWRVFVEVDPWRLILDTSEVDWTGLDTTAFAAFGPVLSGRIGPGWSRLSVELHGPAHIERAWMTTGDTPRINVLLSDGAGRTGPLVSQGWDHDPEPVETVIRPRQTGDGPLVIALDPGHGGVDPGAERGGATEADMMLRFARELAEVLRREGHTVVLTREGDEFVGLRGRTSIARAAGADLMISLHADAVEGGGAQGATVYTLSSGNGDALAAEIAQRHARSDLLLGVTLPEQGDEIAQILVELARAETAPRASMLADALVTSLAAEGVRLHKRPRLGGRFTVLKAPDIPSVLLELGFMSDPQDLANLTSPEWRARMATAIARGIEAWAEADAVEALRLRR